MQATEMTRIVHLSDAHVLDPRPSRTRSGWSMQTRFLSLGRPLDAIARRRKLGRALETARRVGAHHVVVSGDLTEVGAPGEFETLAESLHDSEIPPERITLVPGNHDVYSSADAWRWAIAGPLAAFARTSAGAPGKVLDIGGANLVPIDATFHQPVTRSAGIIDAAQMKALERHAGDSALARRPLILIQHHPPFLRKTSAWHWVDGLIGAARLMSILERFRHVFVLHGHLHAVVDRALGGGAQRIFGVTATVDDEDAARVRVYDVRDGRLASAGLVVG